MTIEIMDTIEMQMANCQLIDNNNEADAQQLGNDGQTNQVVDEPAEITIPETPTVHNYAKAPQCRECVDKDPFFNFDCDQCFAIVMDPATSISQLFAIARQWNHKVQCNMALLVQQILKRGAHPNDKDQLTDMSLLHFLAKSGVERMGNTEQALEMIIYLIEKLNADPMVRCSFNDMTILHIAAYYDVASLIGYLVTVLKTEDINAPCKFYQMKTPLHLAAANLCLKSTRVLLAAGANVLLKDDEMRTPLDCVPDFDADEAILSWNYARDQDIAFELRTILEEATEGLFGEPNCTDSEAMKTAKVVLSALSIEIGDRVIVNNSKVGILRYCGPTQFASGIWTGIEFEEPIGKNDGSIDGLQYFICPPNCGIFAPINKITKYDTEDFDFIAPCNASFNRKKNGRSFGYATSAVDLGFVRSKIDTGLRGRLSDSNGHILSSSSSSVNSEHIRLGCKVFLADKKSGIVRFIGMTQFASGIWYGIELNRPLGKNNGTVQGVSYFNCPNNHGVFVQFPRIVRVLDANANQKASLCSQDESDETSSEMSMPISATSSVDIGMAGALVRASPERSSLGPSPSNRMAKSGTLKRSMSLRYNALNANRMRQSTTALVNNNNNKDASQQSWLRVGVNVFVNGTIAVVRYIGPVHFTDGIFLGVELRTAQGKNDGSIDGVKYFTCKPNHGLLVRPKKVSVRGINGAKLIPDQPTEMMSTSVTRTSTTITTTTSLTQIKTLAEI